MTTGPRLRLGRSLAPGVLAVVLFGVIALVVLNTSFESGMGAGFPDGVSITSEIGYAMLDLSTLQSTQLGMGATEPFLVAFLLVAIVLDAALDASLVLAKREEDGTPVTALRATTTSMSRRDDYGSGSSSGSGSKPTTDGGSAERDSRSTDSADERGDGA